MSGNIPISEIFFSIQGEGPRTGFPSVFIRFWGCNLTCGFCDSRFSWDKNVEKVKSMTLAQVEGEIKKHKASNLVFTGGEPMLRQTDIRDICAAIQPAFVEIETNGTIPSEIDDIVDQYNVSPKFDFQTPIRIIPGDTVFWKFIIRNDRDVHQADLFCEQHKIPCEQIFFQPEGRTREAIAEKIDFVVEAAAARGVRISPRLHVLLWDDKRGV